MLPVWIWCRDLFYKKEPSLGESAGPGYDPSYEIEGHDYPIGLVRWTEHRNFDAVSALSVGLFATEQLITHRFPIENVADSYDLLSGSQSSWEYFFSIQALGFNPAYYQIKHDDLIEFSIFSKVTLISIVGSGIILRRILIPSFTKAGAKFHTIVASSGGGPVQVGRKFGFIQASTDHTLLLDDQACNAVVIATRHDSHARLVAQFLDAGKHVFVEKPLCLSSDESH